MAGVAGFNSSQGNLTSKIRKRYGRIVSFEQSKISGTKQKRCAICGIPFCRKLNRIFCYTCGVEFG
ncbi:MAG: hypothetical protein DA330_00580 [Nitrososphaera sp.]|nr:hypothetical protein [Nitrososphaera sp.]